MHTRGRSWSPRATHEAFSQAGGNPYGAAHASGAGRPGEEPLTAARHQGRRLARIAELLRGGVPALAEVRRILAVLAAAEFTLTLDLSIVGVALPSIQTSAFCSLVAEPPTSSAGGGSSSAR
jgi:hypothetical protein